MLTGIDVNSTRKYVSKMDPDKDNPTEFHIGLLDPVLRAEVDDESSTYEMSSTNPNDKARVRLNWNKRQIMAIKFGLKGIDNFLDPQTNKPIELRFDTINYAGKSRNVIPDRIIAMFPNELRQELAEVILNESKLSEDEQKN
ncbi:MAG: hypothetical protein PHP89_04165 [Candidatus Omnitrophica bacterium]|jgi:hypothetical protein|nr:hypothetical protein [Candidatus Omnitrophota bacterium]